MRSALPQQIIHLLQFTMHTEHWLLETPGNYSTSQWSSWPWPLVKAIGKMSGRWPIFPFCCYSVTQPCLTLRDPMDSSTPDFPVLHHLPEPAQTHVHWVSDAIQPSRLLPSVFPSIRVQIALLWLVWGLWERGKRKQCIYLLGSNSGPSTSNLQHKSPK